MQRDQFERLCTAASAIGADMIDRCGGVDETGTVSIPVEDFRKIAGVLRCLGEAARAAGGELDADGFRFWLPMPQIEAQRCERVELEAQRRELAARLRLHTLAI